MLVRDLAEAMGKIAPLELAESWDNVGLLVGSPERALTGPVLLTIDLTERVLAEAVAAQASAIVAYHPPIWKPFKRVTDSSPPERVILGAIEHGIAIYSPHTAIDAAPGGMTEWLCEGVGGAGSPGRLGGYYRPIAAHVRRDGLQEVKIVTFAPERDVARLRQALASAGAGLIGRYRVCSFAAPGRGTFLGGEGTHPTVGEAGRLEEVPEVRLEMVCSRTALPIALETLRQFHPYEEPAVDVYELLGRPERSAGLGRRLVLDQPATLAQIAQRLKAHLGITMVKLADCRERDEPVTTVGVCPGSGADLAPLARADGCQVYVSGEMTHHEVLAELHAGMSVILCGHVNTERGYLARLADRLNEILPGVRATVSQTDRSPFVPV